MALKKKNTVTRLKPAKIGLRVLTGTQTNRFQKLKAFFLPHSEYPRAKIRNTHNAILPVY
jgi:hypothetical protein